MHWPSAILLTVIYQLQSMADVEEGDKKQDKAGDAASCLVSTLGMFIIDHFKFEDEETGRDLGDKGLGHQIGGGGTYFAIGARMWYVSQRRQMSKGSF